MSRFTRYSFVVSFSNRLNSTDAVIYFDSATEIIAHSHDLRENRIGAIITPEKSKVS